MCVFVTSFLIFFQSPFFLSYFLHEIKFPKCNTSFSTKTEGFFARFVWKKYNGFPLTITCSSWNTSNIEYSISLFMSLRQWTQYIITSIHPSPLWQSLSLLSLIPYTTMYEFKYFNVVRYYSMFNKTTMFFDLKITN